MVYAFFLFLGVKREIKNMSFINEPVGKFRVVLLYQKNGQLLKLHIILITDSQTLSEICK